LLPLNSSLEEIGGEGLVAFLTQGSDSGHLLFGQGSDSDRSDSDHKGSTDLEGSTDKDSSYRVPAGTRQVEKEPLPYGLDMGAA